MRHSILARPLRPPSRINDETVDAEYEKEVQMLEARRQRIAATEEFMRELHLVDKPDVQTKLRLFEENKHAFEVHQQHCVEAEVTDRHIEEQLREDLEHREALDHQRTMSEKQRKLEEARKAMEENRRLAEEKQQRLKEEKEREHAQDRQNLQVLQAAFSQRRLR